MAHCVLNIEHFMKKLIPLFLTLFFIPVILIFSPGCANMIPPTGGPRDSLPPLLIKANPPDSSRNFSAKTITFTFDEYIDQLQNLRENLLVSPIPNIDPIAEAKLKTVTVKLKDTLEPNTTYRIEFGSAIKDINEGNVLKDFSYIFTTGLSIDSLELTGNVVLAETGKTDTTLIVMLHKSSDDSAVKKDKPRYVAKLDGKGNFYFRYMPAGIFYIYALKDEGSTRKYFETTQLFAFADKPVEIKPGAERLTLYAYADKKTQPAPTASGLSLGRAAGNRPDERRLKFATNLSNNRQDLLEDFVFLFEQPLRSFDTAKIRLSTDSSYNAEGDYRWEADSVKKKFTLRINWKEGAQYNIILDRDFAEDTSGRKLLKTDTLSFTTRKRSEYGSVKISFANLDISKNPVLQIVQGDQVIKSFPLTAAEFVQPLFLPGDYELRLLNDTNKNGQWDPGEFFGKHKQPEVVKPIDKRLNVKPDWENEMAIVL
jgi:hypothetical protein